jgi:hypothetical protein
LAQSGLTDLDEEPFLREFDVRPFAVALEFGGWQLLSLPARYSLPLLAEMYAVWLAAAAHQRTLLTFNGDFGIPYRLYDADGILIEDFARYYQPILGKRLLPDDLI